MNDGRGGREGEWVSRGAAGLAVRRVRRLDKCAGKGTREHASTLSLDRPQRNTAPDDRVDIG